MNADITFNKHHNNPASNQAYRQGRGRYANTREILFGLISEATDGMTSKEIAQKTGWAMHTFSGRLAEMKRDGKIHGTGEMRYGAEVLVVSRKPEQMQLMEVA